MYAVPSYESGIVGNLQPVIDDSAAFLKQLPVSLSESPDLLDKLGIGEHADIVAGMKKAASVGEGRGRSMFWWFRLVGQPPFLSQIQPLHPSHHVGTSFSVVMTVS